MFCSIEMKLDFSVLCLFHVIIFNVFVFGKIEYNTHPDTRSRATPHVPRVIDKTCLLKPQTGPCRANLKMYYFEPETMNCSTFSWGGCQGNGNRFDTRSDCMDSCLSKPNQGNIRPKWCYLRFDYGFCFGDVKRWYYDHLWKVCKETIYSGCGGNKNNFYSIEQCESICRFGKGPILKTTTSKDKIKKVLIINPFDATSRRGKNQAMPTTQISATFNNQTYG